MSLVMKGSAALIAAFVASSVFAQAYPAKPVRWVIPMPPGGGTDLISRTVAAKLTEAWKLQVVAENRPGAGGTIGMEAVVRSAADGYTVVLGQAANVTVAPSLYSRLPYDPLKDLTPVTQVIAPPQVVVSHPSFPVRSIKELIAYARAKPTAITYGSSGNGTIGHLGLEMLKSMAKIEMLHIPYTGASRALTELMGGQIAVYCSSMPPAVPQLKAGRLKALGVTAAKRLGNMPDVPAIAETVPGYEAVNWYGVFLPAGAPRDIVNKLHADVAKVINLPDVKERFASEGGEPVGNTPEQFASIIRAEIPRWAKVIKEAKIKVD